MNALEAQSPLEHQVFSAADEGYCRLKDRLVAVASEGISHSDLETLIDKEGRELLRQLFQSHLALRADSAAVEPVVGADSVHRRHRRNGEARRLMTIFGPVDVERVGYALPGSSTLYPLDAALNLPRELHSDGVRRRLSLAAASGAFDDAVDLVRANTGAQPAKRQAREMVIDAAADFERFYEARRAGDPSFDAAANDMPLVLTTDAKGVVMRPENLRQKTAMQAAGRKHKLDKRLSKGEKTNAKRMAQVASIYDIDRHIREVDDVLHELRPVESANAQVGRPRPRNKRVFASVEREAADVVAELFEEAKNRDPEFLRPWVALVDGNRHQIDVVRANAKKSGAKVTLILDVIHALEYLWNAAHAFFGDGSKEGESWVQERFSLILKGKGPLVAAGMRRSATRRGLEGAARKAVDKAADYFLKYKSMMRYDLYLAAGYPIATGVIEGACRYLVKDRMDITGARWGLNGAEAVLKLRALKASGDFDAYWEFHHRQQLHRNHAVRYAGEVIPAISTEASRAAC